MARRDRSNTPLQALTLLNDESFMDCAKVMGRWAAEKTQPDDVYAAVKAAFDGGAHGVLLSRKYSEMTLANLRAAGRAVRDLKIA